MLSCDLQDSRLYNLTQKDWVLEECNLLDADWYKVSLANVDISTCDLSNIRMDVDSIKGSIISEQQAVSLANLLGVTVKK
jgi:uncharacterized protein YjbI with pentapeptide repeats